MRMHSPVARRISVILVVLTIPIALAAQNGPIVSYTPAPPPPGPGAEPVVASKVMGDPSYATLYGGSGYDELLAYDVAKEHACMVGVTTSTDLALFNAFQTSNGGAYDGWIGCGHIITGIPTIATYLGAEGSETITGAVIYRDTLYIVGVTTSMSMPGASDTYQTTLGGGGQDCFISKFNIIDGSGLKTTLFGKDGLEYCSGIAVTRRGVWIAGTTDRPVALLNPFKSEVGGTTDGFIALLDLALTSLKFASLFGGPSGDGVEDFYVGKYYEHDEPAAKTDNEDELDVAARLTLAGWTDGTGFPTTEDAYQPDWAGGIDGFLVSYRYDYETGTSEKTYASLFGAQGDDVPRALEVSRVYAGVVGWTTSDNWNTVGRDRNSGSADAFLYAYKSYKGDYEPTISYVGPSASYNLGLAVDAAKPGAILIGGYTAVPGTGNAFLQAYDLKYRIVGTQFIGGDEPADCNAVKAHPYWILCGGKTAGLIETTPLAMQSEHHGDFDMFGSEFPAPWGYSVIYNLTDDVLSVVRNGEDQDDIEPNSPSKPDVLPWFGTYQYLIGSMTNTYQVDRAFDETTPRLAYTYVLADKAVSVGVPDLEDKRVGILAYNMLGVDLTVSRVDKTAEHNVLSNTNVEPDQIFFVDLPKEQNLRLTVGGEYLDYTPPRGAYRDDYPYYAGVALSVTFKGASGSQNFALELFSVTGAPVEFPITTDAEDEVVPAGLALHANHPNPFRESTTMTVEIPDLSTVRLEIYDIMGRRVRTLVDGLMTGGVTSLEWNGQSDAGQPLSSGTYLARLRVNDLSLTRTMVLAR